MQLSALGDIPYSCGEWSWRRAPLNPVGCKKVCLAPHPSYLHINSYRKLKAFIVSSATLLRIAIPLCKFIEPVRRIGQTFSIKQLKEYLFAALLALLPAHEALERRGVSDGRRNSRRLVVSPEIFPVLPVSPRLFTQMLCKLFCISRFPLRRKPLLMVHARHGLSLTRFRLRQDERGVIFILRESLSTRQHSKIALS